MSVAVIGGAGFIGSNLVDELMVQGFGVVVLDNLSEGKYENLSRWKGNPKLEFVLGDIRDRDLVRRVCDHRSWVFHLAAMSRIQPSISDPHRALEENVMGTLNVLEGCRLGGVRRFIYSASSSCFGDANAASLAAGIPLREDMKKEFGSPYSLSKFVGEELTDLYGRLYGLSTISLRYFNVFGPRHQEEGSYATVIAIFRKQVKERQPMTVVGDGEQRRDFTFVGDVVRANMLAAMNYSANGVFNIGTGKNYSINQVASLIAPNHPTVNIPPRKGEYRITLADNGLAYDVLGWKPLVDLPTGLVILDEFEKRNNLII
jgi:UDP-glucose 4-epimerase